MNNGETSTETTFTRRKFTIPERLDERLQELATHHYQANVSLCLRAAIEDHEATLNDNEALTLHHVEQEIGSLTTKIDSLIDVETEVTSSAQSDQPQADSCTGDVTLSQDQHAEAVTAALQAADTPLRLADIIERCDIPPDRVVRVCERLLDTSVIVSVEHADRYRLSQMEGGE